MPFIGATHKQRYNGNKNKVTWVSCENETMWLIETNLYTEMKHKTEVESRGNCVGQS